MNLIKLECFRIYYLISHYLCVYYIVLVQLVTLQPYYTDLFSRTATLPLLCCVSVVISQIGPRYPEDLHPPVIEEQQQQQHWGSSAA